MHEHVAGNFIQYALSTIIGPSQYTMLLSEADRTKHVDVHVDASFDEDWNKSWGDNLSSVFPRTGYIVRYAECPT